MPRSFGTGAKTNHLPFVCQFISSCNEQMVAPIDQNTIDVRVQTVNWGWLCPTLEQLDYQIFVIYECFIHPVAQL